jgi:hypothetical protein
MPPARRGSGPLNGFPMRTWRAGRVLWRIHRAAVGVWWFSSDGSGRFDPVNAPGVGACYLAQWQLGAFVEVFRTRLELDESDVDARRLARVEFAHDLRLADVTSRRALRFGITAEVGVGGDYDKSQELASAAATAGYDGVRWWVRHDPKQRLVGIALFGPTGAPASSFPLPTPASGELGAVLLEEAQRKFGYRVVPRP